MTHASLFSGIGGAELAATWMGWINLFHCEINPFGRHVLEYWFPESKSYEDIAKTDFTPWRGRVSVLTGGFPCQPFSLAGKRKGTEDNRYLWPQMLRAIREIKPTWVVGENVAGLATMVQPGETVDMGRTDDLFEENHLYRTTQRYTLDEIICSLEDIGYSVQTFLIPALAVGAPHQRERLWIVAHAVNTGVRTSEYESKRKGETRACKRKDGPFGRVERPCDNGAAADAYSDRLRLGKNKQEPTPERHRKTDVGSNVQGGVILTPSASDGLRSLMTMENLKHHNKKNAEKSNLSEQIAHKIGGGNFHLSPLFVEEMMGYPLIWLVLPFLSRSGEKKR